ncbi:MAG: Hsp20/alpha crystallin family protein [Chitinophagaceae bacterium]|jgi:HSP20 family protein|nr:MAG: Hsp20/alpha crystallin family protein [Chitinophagaceae bacterium]
MALIRRSDRTLPSLGGWLDDFFMRDFFGGGLPNFSSTNTSLPACNIRETADNYEVEMAAPGMSKQDFKVTLDGSLLSISSEQSEHSEDHDDGNYSRREFSYQAFQRTFQLPKEVVDEDKIEAKYKNGILHLTIPKREEAKQKPPKMIEVG